jgi:hypothetical protein
MITKQYNFIKLYYLNEKKILLCKKLEPKDR